MKEAHIRAEATRVALTTAQRRLLADLTEFYNEADVARQELASLDAKCDGCARSLAPNKPALCEWGRALSLKWSTRRALWLRQKMRGRTGSVRYELALAQLETLTGRL